MKFINNTKINTTAGKCCRLCASEELLPLIHFGKHPIAHNLLSNPSEGEYIHSVDLYFCESCGLFQLVDPIPADKFYTEYKWLSKWKWNPHLSRLLWLIENSAHGLKKNSAIVEVGCNDGTFLEELRSVGYTNLVGIEPTRDGYEAAGQKGLNIIRSYFTTEMAHRFVEANGQCDFFISRQVLEHVTGLGEFREAIRTILRPGGSLLIEVPNFDFTLTTFDYSAVWEEHVNHFTLHMLRRFFAEAGIRLTHYETASFCGEALIVLGIFNETPQVILGEKYPKEYREKACAYRDYWPDFKALFKNFLEERKKAGERIAIYGAGGRAFSLINFAGLGAYIDFFVDDQPEKQGKYTPGTHLPILPGEALELRSIDLCLLAVNAETEDAVIKKHKAYQDKGGTFLSLCPPSHRLVPFWRNHNT